MKKCVRVIYRIVVTIFISAQSLSMASCIMGEFQDRDDVGYEQQDLTRNKKTANSVPQKKTASASHTMQAKQSRGGQHKSEASKDDTYKNYKETDRCVNGTVIYEGDDEHYIIETELDYYIVRIWGGFLNVGDRVRGDFTTFYHTYIINRYTKDETRIDIEYKAFTPDMAIHWLARHRLLHPFDQVNYDEWDEW